MTDQNYDEKEYAEEFNSFNNELNDEEEQNENNNLVFDDLNDVDVDDDQDETEEKVSFVDTIENEFVNDKTEEDIIEVDVIQNEEKIKSGVHNILEKLDKKEDNKIIYIGKEGKVDKELETVEEDKLADEKANPISNFFYSNSDNITSAPNTTSNHSSKPSLCDLIRENINKKYYATFKSKSGNYSGRYYNDINSSNTSPYKENNNYLCSITSPSNSSCFSPIKTDKDNLNHNLILSTKEIGKENKRIFNPVDRISSNYGNKANLFLITLSILIILFII
jgi:hypothetical protein